MLKCELGQAYQVADAAVQSIEQVSEVYSTSGQYDLIMKFHLDQEVDIGRFVTTQVQTLPGVKDTFTQITINAITRIARDDRRSADAPRSHSRAPSRS